MSEDDNNHKNEDKDDDKNIIHFPSLEKRARLEQNKKQEGSEQRREDKKRHKLEEQYRAQYRAEQAKRQSQQARGSSGEKVPFFNWENIPPAVRILTGLILVTHILLLVFVRPENNIFLTMHLGFMPGMYTGSMAWSNFALISPITSLFIHDGWMHIITNSFMLLIMGSLFERNYGAKYMVALFFASAFCGHLFYFMYDPFATTRVIGASGGISGLFGAVILMMEQRKASMGMGDSHGPLPFILIWICVIVGLGIIFPTDSWQSHLGGFLGGTLLYHLWRIGKIRF